MGWLRGVTMFAGISCFGIILAAMLYELHSRGIFIDDLVTRYSWEITDMMAIIIILFMLLAGVLAVVASD